MEKFWRFIATGCRIGELPGAPGTYGTVVGIVLFILVHGLPWYLYLLFCAGFVGLAIWATANVLSYYQQEDPKVVVVDEIAGFLVTMIGLPLQLGTVLFGFAFFRLFDIWKPYPIRLIEEKVKGAKGVVLDDVLAGVLACAATWICYLIFLA